VKDFAFQPKTVTVRVGDTVTWSNIDSATHTATSTGNWDTGNIPPGSSRSIALTTPGMYAYFCLLHSIMFGTIVVVAADATFAPTATPAPSVVVGEATPSPSTSQPRPIVAAAAADATPAAIVLRRPSEAGPGPILVAAAALAIVALSAFAWSVGRRI
jgi:cupredoxin-like protein